MLLYKLQNASPTYLSKDQHINELEMKQEYDHMHHEWRYHLLEVHQHLVVLSK